MTKSIVAIKSYSASYGERRVLKKLNLQIEDNETYAVLGPSGCGKTTFLYAIANLLPSDCKTEGDLSRREGIRISTVLQDFGLFPWKTVLENTLLPFALKSKGPRPDHEESYERAYSLLKWLKLETHLHHYPSALSGGQKQRVAIARSWLNAPDLLLLDEPFSSLDAITRESLQEEVLTLYEGSPLSIVIVTHSIEEAVFMGKNIIILSQNGEIRAQLINPSFGLAKARDHEIFYSQCLEIRKLMKDQEENSNNAMNQAIIGGERVEKISLSL